MRKIILLGHPEKSITGGHKYNDAFGDYLEKVSGIKIEYSPSCANRYKGWRKFISPFAELKHLSKFSRDGLVIFGDTLFKYHFLLAFFNKWVKKAKSTMIIHHFIFVGQQGFRWRIIKWFMCKYASMMDSIIIPSPYTLDLAKELFPHKKIFYVPLPFQQVYKQSERYEVGNLLYVGTIEERKGLSYLIDAISLLENKNEVKLNIVGKVVDRIYSEKLNQQIEALGLSNNVCFHGRVSDEALIECYQKAEIFTFPSLLEGYGIVLIEAFNNGLPIICFNNTAMPYTVKDGVNGFVAKNEDSKDMAEKIQQLIGNAALRSRLQEGIKDTVMQLKTKEDFNKGISIFYKHFCSDC